MKLLRDILYKVSVNSVYGSTDVSISEITFDSRTVISKAVYVAQKGVFGRENLGIEIGRQVFVSEICV